MLISELFCSVLFTHMWVYAQSSLSYEKIVLGANGNYSFLQKNFFPDFVTVFTPELLSVS